MSALLLAAIGCLAQAGAVGDPSILPRSDGAPPSRMLRDHLMAGAKSAFAVRRDAVASIKTPQDLEARQVDLRAKFWKALGGPPDRTPLNARVVRAIDRDGYRVEMVIYESRPGHHVTANLYIPDGPGPFPGVLMPIGHSENGKAADYVQRGAMILAKNGMACLAYDPIGQGERKQLLDAGGKPSIAGSTTEHTLIGIGALLVGGSTASYRIWDGVRGLDYLESRPEIDPKRLGCTGVSGGGTLTSYLMALDDRIAAAAPSCYITTLERLFETIGPQDAEQNIPGQAGFGMDHADYVTMRAPRPTLLLAASRDFFDIDGTWTAFREAKKLYTLLGVPERVEIVESDGGHGYPREHREPMARWMGRWLLGKDVMITESESSIAPDAELLCTETGQVLSALKGKSCFDLTREAAEALAAVRPNLSPDEFRRVVRRLLALPEIIPAARRTVVSEERRDGYTLRKLVFDTEPGIRLPAMLFEPETPKDRGLVMMVGGMPAAAFAASEGAARMARDGSRVLKVDLRGLGETATSPGRTKWGPIFGPDVDEAFLAMHLGRPLLGQRTFDILAVLAAVTPSAPGEIRLVGADRASVAALHAAALDDRVTIADLDGLVISWGAVASTPIPRDQLAQVVPGALRSYDLPDLTRLIAPRALDLKNPALPSGEPAAAESVRAAWRTASDAYRASGAPANFGVGTVRRGPPSR